ncbi:MAG: GFA family protein [Steroidobacteraceae bacterium]
MADTRATPLREVRICIAAAPILTMTCHCSGCQRMSASAFSLSAAFPSGGFVVGSRKPVLGGLHNPEPGYYCCRQCMRWMFARFSPEFVNVQATLLENAAWFSPFIESWTKTPRPWARTPMTHSYAEFSAAEDYSKLTAEFVQALL